MTALQRHGGCVLAGFRDGQAALADPREPPRALPPAALSQGSSARLPSSVSGLAPVPGSGGEVVAATLSGGIHLLDIRSLAGAPRGGARSRPHARPAHADPLTPSAPATPSLPPARAAGPVLSYSGHVGTHKLLRPAVDPSGSVVGCCGEDGALRLWSARGGGRPLGPGRAPAATLRRRCPRALVAAESCVPVRGFPGALTGGPPPPALLPLAPAAPAGCRRRPARPRFWPSRSRTLRTAPSSRCRTPANARGSSTGGAVRAQPPLPPLPRRSRELSAPPPPPPLAPGRVVCVIDMPCSRTPWSDPAGA